MVLFNGCVILPITVEKLREVWSRTSTNKALIFNGIPSIVFERIVKARYLLLILSRCASKKEYSCSVEKTKLDIIFETQQATWRSSVISPGLSVEYNGENDGESETDCYPSSNAAMACLSFPRGHSTMDAVSMVPLDVKNAFNLANWSQIKGALAEIVPGYLASLAENYL